MEPSSNPSSPTERRAPAPRSRVATPVCAAVATAIVAVLASVAGAQRSAPPPQGGGTPYAIEEALPRRSDSRPAAGMPNPCNTSPLDELPSPAEVEAGTKAATPPDGGRATTGDAATADTEAPAATADTAAPDATPAAAPPGSTADAATPDATAPAAPTPAEAPPPPDASGKSPIVVEADSLEIEKDGVKVKASGNVDLQWDTTRLRAGEVRVDQRERTVEASGGVAYRSDELRATAKSVVVDVDAETGTLDDVEMHLQGEPGRFGGSRLEKTEGRRVLLEDGYFTTCPVDEDHPPDWELRGKHLDVRFDDYARMRGARLEVRGVPILYLPYLVFPTKQTRQSGLLPFSLGTSTNRGVIFNLPGYWAIDKHQDLTMTAVVETSARVGLDGVYRYAPSARRWGELHASYYNEEIRGDAKPGTPAVGVPDNRGSVELIHREHGRGWTGYSDIQWVGDERFLREVASLEGDAPERDTRRSKRYTMNRLGAIARRGFTSGGVEAVAYQDLIGAVVDDGDPTSSDPVLRDTQHKPFNGWLQTDRNIGPVAFALDSSVASFIREKGAGGERLDVASTFALPLLVEGPIQSRAWANGRGSFYAMNERDVLDDREEFVQRLDRFPLRGVFMGGIDARSRFARDFSFETEKWTGLYHSIEPFAGLRYTNRSSIEEIPLFDRLDAIDGRDVGTYGIDQRFLLRRGPGANGKSTGPFELGRLSISQTYNFTRGVLTNCDDVTGICENDHKFSDIDFSAFVQPLEGFALRTLTSYNVGANQVRGANASISWETGPMGPILRGPNTQIAAAYRYVRSDTEDDVLQSTEMLARLAFTRNFALGLKALYDIVGNTFVEKAVGVTFTSSCDCWSIGLGIVERVNPAVSYGLGDRGNPDELQVRLAFELSGLGGFGSGVTQRNSPALDSVEYEDIGFWRAGW